MNIENARLLLHFTILQANLVGAPRGKALSTNSTATPPQQGASGIVAGPSAVSVVTGVGAQMPPVPPAPATTAVLNSDPNSLTFSVAGMHNF